MQKIVVCVPNFSEGRRPEIIEAITAEIHDIPDVFLLGKEMDADHNRTVVTIAGEPEAVKEGVFRMIKKAADLIDLRTHTGGHPRMGATDVVPFVPAANITMGECVRLAQELGQRVGNELEIPVFLYEEAATRPERKNLAQVRKGQFEGLRDAIGTNPDRIPDYGPNRIHPTAGATAIGARFFLVAYNVNLDSQDLSLAKRIAARIRESNGGFPCVKALGLALQEKHCVQVSMNMTNYMVTSLATVYTTIQREAEAAGVSVLESEIIGFLPRAALLDTAQEFLQLTNFHADQILENRIAQIPAQTDTVSKNTGDTHTDFMQAPLAGFLANLASADPTPGGGSVSALAGALAAALARMMCHLTIGKKKYQSVARELEAIQIHAHQIQEQLGSLISEDSQAYNAVLAAFTLPNATEEEKNHRTETIQKALKAAAHTPLEVMKHALRILGLIEPLAAKGNPNAITDVGCAIHLAHAAIAGAALNVRINLASITDLTFIRDVEAEMTHILRTAQELEQQVLTIVESKIS